MRDRVFAKKRINNSPVARPVSSRVFVWLTVIAVAGALLTCSFVISARQHFQAVTMGYESEQLRRQLSQVEDKLQKLELERARATSPIELERRASALGLSRPKQKRAAEPGARRGSDD
jgi:hypothetical protein